MPWNPEPRIAGPRPWLVILVCAVFLLAGLVGHDPWKSEDAVGIGIAHGFAAGGDWRVPAVAGEPVVEAEPLYHWLAAATAGAVRPWLTFHDGARLAAGIFAALFLIFLAGAARRLHGPEAGWGAPLLAVGTVGLMVPLHEAQPAAAVLATAGLAYWGAALGKSSPLAGALLLGIGVGASLPAGGLNALLPLAPLLLVPLALGRWAGFLAGILVAAAVAASWPAVLAQGAPGFLDAWWRSELATIASQRGFSRDHAEWLGWFSWPVLFIAAWALWTGRRQLATLPVALPLFGTVVAAGWFLAHEPKAAATLPLLPPLLLLAAFGAGRLRRGAANALDWFGIMTFTLVAGLIWLGASAMLLGWPPTIARNFAKLAPGFAAEASMPALAAAAAVTTIWLLLLLRQPRSPWRGIGRWAAGLTVMWALLTALWLPWIDYGKTYRPVAAGLRQALPADAGCIGRHDLGLPQRASLDYFAGIRTRAQTAGCRWLIHQGGPREPRLPGWTAVWTGHRPGDKTERLRLYRRD